MILRFLALLALSCQLATYSHACPSEVFGSGNGNGRYQIMREGRVDFDGYYAEMVVVAHGANRRHPSIVLYEREGERLVSSTQIRDFAAFDELSEISVLSVNEGDIEFLVTYGDNQSSEVSVSLTNRMSYPPQR